MQTSRRLFYSISFISFIGPFLSTGLTIALPQVAAGFGVPAEQVSWVVTAYLIGTASLLLPLGKFADVYGRRRVYAAALMAFAICTLAAAFAPSLSSLIACRLLQGAALAAVYVTYMPLLLTTTDEQHQGLTLGTAVALTYLGLTLGPVLGGFLTGLLGWRSIFIISALVTGGAWLLVCTLRQEWYGTAAPFVNAVSSVLCISGVGIFLYGLSAYAEHSWPVWLGLALLVCFIVHERYSRHPLLPLFLFRNRVFSFSSLAALIQYSATYAITFLLSLYLQLVLGLTPAKAGFVLLSQPVMMALLSRRSGHLADLYGSRLIASAGLAITAVGLAGLAWAPQVELSGIVAFLVLTGIGSALFGAPNNAAIMGSVKEQFQGTAASILALVRNAGQSMSMALVTLVFAQMTLVVTPYTAAVLTAVHVSFLLLAGFCVLAMIASWQR